MSSVPMLLRSWWILALRGVLAVLFALLALAMPGVTLLTVIALFAVYALLAGAVSVVGAIRNRHHASDWWVLLLLGAVTMTAGVLASLHPVLTVLALVLVIGVNALATGVLDLVLALRLRRELHGGEWGLMLSAVAAIVFGAVVVALPELGALVLVWLISVYALVTGLLTLSLAYHAYTLHAEKRLAGVYGRSGGPDRRVRERRASPVSHA